MKIALGIWILWSVAIVDTRGGSGMDVVRIPLDTFQSVAECKSQLAQGHQGLQKKNIEGATAQLACLPDTIQPPR